MPRELTLEEAESYFRRALVKYNKHPSEVNGMWLRNAEYEVEKAKCRKSTSLKPCS
jgi:hypothetical protein